MLKTIQNAMEPRKKRTPKAQQIAIEQERERRGYERDTSLPLPLRLEIEEGAAWLRLQEDDSEENRKAWGLVWNRLGIESPASQGILRRCADCGTVKWGRFVDDACGHCGGIQTWLLGLITYE